MKTLTFAFALFVVLMTAISCTRVQTYTVGDINDAELIKYPPPAPVHPDSQSFVVSSVNQVEELTVNSQNLRNLSITIENTGTGIIKNPYLFGPQGWDMRGDSTAFSALAANITDGNLTKEQMFFRAFDFTALHMYRSELGNVKGARNPYPGNYHAGNGSRLLNHYGASMCGEFHNVINPIFAKIPGAGMYGVKYSMGNHTAGGAFWDGAYHDFNGTPDIQMVHYKMDGKTIATFEDLKKDPSPIDSVKLHTGHTWGFGACYNPDSSVCPLNRSEYKPAFYNSDYLIRFRFSDLRPGEKMTMYFDMRGRYDSVSNNFDEYKGRSPRNWVDYGSVVYTYKPNFHNSLYEPFVVEQGNVQRTRKGLVPVDPSQPSFIVFASNHYPWYHVGADIKAWFKTKGNVYIARNNSIPGRGKLGIDTVYTNLTWVKLDSERKDYDSVSIAAKSACWIKFEFQGRGSGIDSAEISSELQMSTYTMPGLLFGKNYIRFTADDLGGSAAKVTYRYDDKSTYYFYEPATTPYGKHIYHRLGGRLGHTFGNYRKAAFWPRLIDSANVVPKISVKIYNAQNTPSIKCVRTLIDNKPVKWGYYWWFWDGKDDQGNLLPPGMYAYRIDTRDGQEVIHVSYMYLYPDLVWPLPNELRSKPAETFN